jgi:hypothetical protein
MSEPRFVVTELTGWTIFREGIGRSSNRPVTTFYVEDRLYMMAVVRTFENKRGHNRSKTMLRAIAAAECDRLNAWWQEEMAVG